MDGVPLPTWDIHNDHDIGTFSKNAVILETDRLMYGVHRANDIRRDISNGAIYGVYYYYDGQGRKIWEKGLAPLVFPWTRRNPVHN